MTLLDWLVVAAYLTAMLAIGWYYSRRTKNTEDYLLGGRRLGSSSVGLSLFASLMSTISYLAYPGEVIEHGPTIAADVLTYPIVFLIVGYFLIPYFMKQRVTSAYEILETRFGLGVRLLGSSLFLLLRLIWMGVVIFVTTSQVLVPLMQLPSWTTPFACIVMGFVTVTYTSVGGLRAVVLTDAIQSLILIGGALLTVIVIAVRLGGLSQCVPVHWPQHWDGLHLGIDPEARVTVFAVAIAGLVWWVCTAGSDQIAIQRYLATRDAHAARSALAVSLTAGLISTTLLTLVGIVLLAYFQSHPEQLPSGANVDRNADSLFPRFIVMGFPAGARGVVIAGLLAAAMSSLSSGVNSACSVISADFWDRLGRRPANEDQHVRRTKAVAWVVGTVAVACSTLVGLVEGNLIEVCFKAVNLLVGPLFLLFFMAMFVPWATPLGAVAAAATGTLFAVAIAYFDAFGLSFIWILPVSVLTGAIVGPIISLIRAPRTTM